MPMIDLIVIIGNFLLEVACIFFYEERLVWGDKYRSPKRISIHVPLWGTTATSRHISTTSRNMCYRAFYRIAILVIWGMMSSIFSIILVRRSWLLAVACPSHSIISLYLFVLTGKASIVTSIIPCIVKFYMAKTKLS